MLLIALKTINPSNSRLREESSSIFSLFCESFEKAQKRVACSRSTSSCTPFRICLENFKSMSGNNMHIVFVEKTESNAKWELLINEPRPGILVIIPDSLSSFNALLAGILLQLNRMLNWCSLGSRNCGLFLFWLQISRRYCFIWAYNVVFDILILPFCLYSSIELIYQLYQLDEKSTIYLFEIHFISVDSILF